MTFNWLGRPHDEARPYTDETDSEPEPDLPHAQVASLTARLQASEDRLEEMLTRLNQTLVELHGLRQDLASEREARELAETELSRRLQALEDNQPAARMHSLGQDEPAASALGILARMQALAQTAPPQVQAALEGVLQETPAERDRDRLVPEFAEVCEAAARQGDPDHPFFAHLDESLAALAQAAGLEEIRPAPLTPYMPSDHNVLKAVRGEGERDRVERCLSRGYKRDGVLLKKADVTVYL